jgi:formylglycine-generating enzyme required for sulfatase activity
LETLYKYLLIFLVAAAATPAPGQLLLSDSCDVTGGNSPGTGFGPNSGTAGVNYQISSRLSGSASAGLSYFQTLTSKPGSNYSIQSNKIHVATAANSGRFTFSADSATPKDFGSALGSVSATPGSPVVYDLSAKIANQSPSTPRTSFGLTKADDGIQNWDLGIQPVNNGANLDLYRRIDAACNPSAADYNNVIATLPGLAGTEVDLRLRITDAGGETGAGNFNSHYDVYANGALVFSSAAGDFRFSSSARLILFDTAGGTGPVTYDAIGLSLVGATNAPPPSTNRPFAILSYKMIATGFELTWASQPGSNYSVLKCTNLTSKVWTLATNLTAGGTNTSVVDPTAGVAVCYYCVAQLAQSGLGLAGISASQRSSGSPYVDIFYDLSDLYSGAASISVLVSTDGGVTYHAAAASFSGDVGSGIASGLHKHIVWNAGADLASLSLSNVRIKIVADRALAGPTMALIPGGAFNMGDAKAEGLDCEVPVHSVNVGDFYLERYEVTKGAWDKVRQWGTNHGYVFENPGVGVTTNIPVQQVSWYDAAKWCNARSEMEGIAPAYYANLAWTSVYRTGQVNLAEANVRWQGGGYRLATEAEWEKAARGGLSGNRFPFGDTITQGQANYWSTTFETFDVNGAEGPHPSAMTFPNLLTIGSFKPTGYGLYDMAGNIWEWCWDYYGDTWYQDSRAGLADTHGPSSASWGGDRVYRGGAGVDIAWKSRVANRADAPPRFAMGHFGFRVALPAGSGLVSATSSTFNLTP